RRVSSSTPDSHLSLSRQCSATATQESRSRPTHIDSTNRAPMTPSGVRWAATRRTLPTSTRLRRAQARDVEESLVVDGLKKGYYLLFIDGGKRANEQGQ